jgi:predicted lipoprotein with Yx(FWY)xxD motif
LNAMRLIRKKQRIDRTMRHISLIFPILHIALAFSPAVFGQSTPSKEYVYLGSKLVAVEAAASGAAQVPPTLASVSPSSTTSATQTFAVTARDSNGYADISRVYFLINTTPSIPAGSCHGFYDRASNGLYVYNDAVTAVSGPITPGVAGTIQNSQCAINGAASSVTSSGTDVVLNLSMTRQGTYSFDTRTLYIWVKDNANADTGWIFGSTWALPQNGQVPPTLVGVSPSSTTSATQTFTVTARDSNGFADINKIYFLINTAPNIPAGSCHGFYDRASNGIYVYNDAVNATTGPATPGVAGIIQNSQCAINGAASSVTASGTDVVLNLNITRQGAYSFEARTFYIWVKDNANDDTGWIVGSSWILPATGSQVPPTFAGNSPTSTTAATQIFTVTARDSNGFADINRIYFLINTAPNIPAGSCHGFYDRASNGIYVYNDAVTATTGPVTPGVAGTIQNSQCAINGATSSVTSSGTDVVLNLSLTRQGSYASGAKTLYIWVKDNQNNDTGWIVGSAWTL